MANLFSAIDTSLAQMNIGEGAGAAAAVEGAVNVAPIQRGQGAGMASAASIVQALDDARGLNASWVSSLPKLLEPSLAGSRSPALVLTSVPGVWDTFVAALPDQARMAWSGCRACERWINTRGHIAVLRDQAVSPGETGSTDQAETSASASSSASSTAAPATPILTAPLLVPLFWSELSERAAPAVFGPSFRAVRALFEAQGVTVTGAFIPISAPANSQPGAGAGKGRNSGSTSTAAADTSSATNQEQNKEDGEPEGAAAALIGLSGANNAAAASSASSSVAAPSKPCVFWHLSYTFPARLCKAESDAHGYPTLRDMLVQTLSENSAATVAVVHRWLVSRELPYADTHIPAAEMLSQVHARYHAMETPEDKSRVIWQALCARGGAAGMVGSMRSGMVSVLLGLAYSDTPFDDVSRKWSALADPTSYMRSTEAPSAGNVAAAQRLFESLGITNKDLQRHVLRRQDLPAQAILWQQPPAQPGAEEVAQPAAAAEIGPPTVGPPQSDPAAAVSSSSSAAAALGAVSRIAKAVVAALVPAAPAAPVRINFLTLFTSGMLDRAAKVEMQLPKAGIDPAFVVTGALGTVPLMQWHTTPDHGGNLASSYGYSRLQPASTFGLQPSPEWTNIHTVIKFPHMWQDDPATPAKLFPQHGHRYLLALSGARDSASPRGTLFPAYMHSKFHGVRSTIEAHNRTPEAAVIGGPELQAAEGVAGVMIDVAPKPAPSAAITLRVTDAQGKQTLYEVASEGEADKEAVLVAKKQAAAAAVVAAAPASSSVAQEGAAAAEGQ